jgi:hypothetical protein
VIARHLPPSAPVPTATASPDAAANTPPANSHTIVALDPAPPQLASHWCQRSRVEVSTHDGSLRCEVTALDDGSGTSYGGVRLPIVRPARLRLDLELVGLEHVDAVYVYGEDARHRRHLRWQWSRPSIHRSPRDVFELVAGEDGGSFRALEPAAADDVTEVHVFLRVAPGQRAGFVLHGVESWTA